MPATRKILACATVIEEMLPLIPAGVAYQVFDFGLHVSPTRLRAALQDAIDAAAGTADEVILGYGCCSLAVVGLRASGCTLVVPRVDDCIGLFLGSASAYRQQILAEPGTYYLTKGWLEVGDTPFDAYEPLTARYGPQRADWLIRQTIRHYTRLALIDTGQQGMGRYRQRARELARRWDLRFEEIQGSDALVRQLLAGSWDENCVVTPPGNSIEYDEFFPGAEPGAISERAHPPAGTALASPRDSRPLAGPAAVGLPSPLLE